MSMSVSNLELKNFRGFTNYEIEFDKKITILIGKNGSGKTNILDALIGSISSFIHQNPFDSTQSTSHPSAFVNSDRHRSLDCSQKKNFLNYASPNFVRSTFHFFSKKIENNLEFKGKWGSNVTKMFSFHTMFSRNESETDPIKRPVLAYYPAYRTWSKTGYQEYQIGSWFDAYSNWQTAHVNHQQVTGLIKYFTFIELQEGKPVPQLTVLKELIVNVLDEITDVSFNVRDDALHITFGEKIVAFDQLSAGFKAIIAMIADIAWRAITLNPHLEEKVALETPGIVLIDELDLHLHPAWQHKILEILQNSFPKIQFIVTTHSPLILSTADPSWIRILTDDDKPERISHSRGLDSNNVLKRIMGTNSRYHKTEKLLTRLFDTISNENIPQAEELLEEVRNELGEDDPIVTRAHWMIRLT